MSGYLLFDLCHVMNCYMIKDVWKFIKDDDTIKIIHLVRENKLRSYVSSEIARKTDQWTRKTNYKIPLEEKRITIDPSDMLSKLRITENYENETRKTFKSHQFLEISYEDLTRDKEIVMESVFKFLDVKKSDIVSSHKKQNSETLKDLIVNYDEVQTTLKNSEFDYLLKMNSM